MRILAVDDDPLILELLPVVFRQAAFPQISVASSGTAALEMLADPEAQFDCLLLDIEMPEMNGIALCQRIRQLPRFRSTPILMLTSVTDHARIERAFAAGANDYISKPFDVKEITTRVRIAERMVDAVAGLARLDARDLPHDGPRGLHHFEVSDTIGLGNVPQVILPFSLGNYLSQLSRNRIDACQVFAVHLEEIETLYAECNTHEYVVALGQVARAVTQVADYPHMLMAYNGSGDFLCITQGDKLPEWPDIEDRIMDVLRDAELRFDDGRPMALSVAAGNPVTPFASRTQRVKKTFDRAIDRAMVRVKTKKANAGLESLA
jgi:CheY-like chemotaxis protein